MERFWNSAFAIVHTLLGEHQARMEMIDPECLSEILRDHHLGTASILEGYFKLNGALSLPYTKLAADRVIATLRDENCNFTLKQTLDSFDRVFERLWDELESGGHFFYVPIKRAAWFDVKEPFGPTVSKKFPKLSEDIEASSDKCYACGRYTACVFHLMRVMEVAVQRFGKKLKVAQTQSLAWQNILDQINAAIKSLPQKSARTKKFASIAGHLYNVKLAWRNEVMHPKATYTKEEAEALLTQVRSFT